MRKGATLCPKAITSTNAAGVNAERFLVCSLDRAMPDRSTAVSFAPGEKRPSPTRMRSPRENRAPSSKVRILLVTERAALEAVFREVAASADVDFALERVSFESIDRDCADSAAVALVDLALEPLAAISRCRELASLRPDLAVVGLVCCPYAVTPWSLHALLASGIASILDLRSSKDELAAALEAIAGGASVLNVRVAWRHGPLLRDMFARDHPRADLDLRMLELLAFGFPDHEIGRRLHLSPHTIKHHVEHLRWELGLQNRIELAAWAGRHGFYRDGVQRPETDEIVRPRPPVASSRRAV